MLLFLYIIVNFIFAGDIKMSKLEKIAGVIQSIMHIFEDGKISLSDIPQAVQALKLITEIFTGADNESETKEN